MLYLMGCGPSEVAPAGARGGQTDGSSPPSLSLSISPVRFGDFDMMTEERVIRAVTTFSDTNYFLDGATPRGATYEGLMEFGNFVNERLGTGRLKVHVVVMPVQRDELFQALVDGKADIAAANLTVTPERLESVDFSDPVATNVREVLVTGPGSPELTGLDDLAGREIHVRRSSSYHESLTALSQTFFERGLEPIRIVDASELLETEDIIEMVGAGVVPLTVADNHIASFWSELMDGVVVREDLVVGTGRSIAWAFRKDSPKLAAEVNAFVASHKQGSLFGNVVLKRYFEDNEWMRNPLAGGELAKLKRYRGYFKKYADQYGMNWVALAAQGYQESKLDQDLVSPAGAVGIMQIKPATAADKNVGIADVGTAENNIHAGIKYMRFLRDRYFKDDDLSELDEVFFTLAAYNAGPARVRKFRQQAEEQGLDPNVWFQSVERMAGRETVQYVTNVFKYWLTYESLIRQEEAKG
jgi:membrane-bound lytic murein transglycosylase MltF